MPALLRAINYITRVIYILQAYFVKLFWLGACILLRCRLFLYCVHALGRAHILGNMREYDNNNKHNYAAGVGRVFRVL